MPLRFQPWPFSFYCPRVQSVLLSAVLFSTLALPAAEPRLHIVTSFLPIYSWTVNVAGEHAQVENLLPPRAEPHEYAFTPGDARKLARADLVIVNGLGLETWLPKFLHSTPDAKTRLVSVSTGLESQLIEGRHRHRLLTDTDPADDANPHIWLDPQLAMHAVTNILAALQRADPVHAIAYASNAQLYAATLRKLDQEIEQSLGLATNRAIVTYHDAFPYFARRYHLEIAGVVEEVPDVNPTPKYLARLSHVIRDRRIPVIFKAAGSSSRLARRIAEDLRTQLDELDTLESGPLGPSAYEERMRRNALVLRKYLK